MNPENTQTCWQSLPSTTRPRIKRGPLHIGRWTCWKQQPRLTRLLFGESVRRLRAVFRHDEYMGLALPLSLQHWDPWGYRLGFSPSLSAAPHRAVLSRPQLSFLRTPLSVPPCEFSLELRAILSPSARSFHFIKGLIK